MYCIAHFKLQLLQYNKSLCNAHSGSLSSRILGAYAQNRTCTNINLDNFLGLSSQTHTGGKPLFRPLPFNTIISGSGIIFFVHCTTV